jgi:hypothetical protein
MTRRRLLALLSAAATTRAVQPAPVRFTDIASQSGLLHKVYYGGENKVDYIVEANGCGVAFYDYDNDGWLDIFVLNGSRLQGFLKGTEPSNRLYKNNRDGTFTDVTAKAGLLRTGWAQAVCIGDYDNDGNDDLFITYWGENVLYRNNGDGTFTDVTRKAGLLGDPKRWNSGCTFVDFDRDGNLDLLVAGYLDVRLEELPLPGQGNNCTWKGEPVFCGPRGLKGSTNLLYRSNGDGTFTDVTRQAGIGLPGLHYGMTATLLDYNDDGWPDIFVVCDSTPSILYRNNRNGTFSDVALEAGVAYSGDGREQAGMGVATFDINNDGLPDLVKTLFADEMPALYTSDKPGFFSDDSIAAGLHVLTNHVQWGVGLADLDNDSHPDLFYVTGHLYPELEKANALYPYRGPRVFFRNMGGVKFERQIEGVPAALHSSRGCAFGDFDNDGDVDILIMNMNEPPSLLRADLAPGNHWIKIKLIGTKSNRTAIGARVKLRAGGRLQVQDVQSQSSYYSVNDLRLHFGLGKTAMVDAVDIRWPSGLKQSFQKLPADVLVTIREGAPKPEIAKLPAAQPSR